MRLIRDFLCSSKDCGATHEHFLDSEVMEVRCKTCDSTASKIQSPVQCSLDPISGHFPGSTIKWAKEHEQKANKRSPA